MNKKKKIILASLIVLVIVSISICFAVIGCQKKKSKVEDDPNKLPLPELAEGARGELGIDKNINEEVIDQYLNRDDAVYRDMRMLEDPGNYEAIGGDSMLSGYIKGFEIIPLPYIIKVSGLPEDVGYTYRGRTLFSITDDGKYVANYEESMSIIEKYFPKDKYIFLMCGGGGYAGMMKNFLVSLGWDTNKIYNIGGYWYYKGENNVEVKKVVDGKTSYDFENIPYIKIDFSKLTPAEIQLETQDVIVEKVNLSPQKLSLVIGEKYNLIATILPSNATERRVTWTSSDEDIVTVNEGAIVAKKEGKATISVKTLDGEFIATTEVTVTKEPVVNYITLSNISKELQEFQNLDKQIEKAWEEYSEIIYDKNGDVKPEYWTEEGIQSQEGHDIELATMEEADSYRIKKYDILDNLMKNKKTFIVILEQPICYEKDFSQSLSAQKILKNNKIPYFVIDLSTEESYFEESKLYFNEDYLSFIVIVKDGKLYTYAKEEDGFKKDDDVKKWLGKYIKVK